MGVAIIINNTGVAIKFNISYRFNVIESSNPKLSEFIYRIYIYIHYIAQIA